MKSFCGDCWGVSTQSVIHLLLFFIAIDQVCLILSLPNGMISYDTDPDPPPDTMFNVGTVATHSCDVGFSLVGDTTRTCMDDPESEFLGMWSGNAPSCERKTAYNSYSEVSKFCTRFQVAIERGTPGSFTLPILTLTLLNRLMSVNL